MRAAPTWLLTVDIAGVHRCALATPANTEVSLPLQLMKAAVPAESYI